VTEREREKERDIIARISRVNIVCVSYDRVYLNRGKNILSIISYNFYNLHFRTREESFVIYYESTREEICLSNHV